ncbi:MAG TPA: HAMP domain-containing sensor histidine kinase, partial [Bacteroidia bacterium]|nr:HAMP domain-containing sensor histidine kinase [Bacteroidia bacterium]
EFAVKVIKEGADDYILKNNMMRLPSAIDNAIKKKKAEREREQTLAQLLLTNNELNTFVYKATHDLRGPLTSIMGLTNLAQREEDDSRLRAYVKMIGETTEKLDEVLLSLIETMAIKNAQLTKEEINLPRLIPDILKNLRFVQGFDRVRFNLNISMTSAFISDKRILNSVLQNLIENSIRYQDHSKAISEVNISIADHKDGAMFEVADNGIGISENIQEKIFDMFYRGHTGSKGSGLGLYILKNGVQRLGGKFELKSKPGFGTSFCIFLPSLQREDATVLP